MEEEIQGFGGSLAKFFLVKKEDGLFIKVQKKGSDDFYIPAKNIHYGKGYLEGAKLSISSEGVNANSIEITRSGKTLKVRMIGKIDKVLTKTNEPDYAYGFVDGYRFVASTFFSNKKSDKDFLKEHIVIAKMPQHKFVNKDNPVTNPPQEIQDASIEKNKYVPESDVCDTVETVSPASMRYEMKRAIETIDRRVNGVDEYVAEKLGYIVGKASPEERKRGLKFLCDAFSAEQVDALAVAIYNIEKRGEGLIVGDQTGIGKGRIAAGLIRYGVLQGKKPIFLTEKSNLFSDIFRDIIAIGSDGGVPMEFLTGYKEKEKRAAREDGDEETDPDSPEPDQDETEIILIPRYQKNINYEGDIIGKKRMKPYIINGSGSGTAIKDIDGNILYKGIPNPQNTEIIKKQEIPADCSFMLGTYSQFRSEEMTDKKSFILAMAADNIVIMDESHNASGSSNSGAFLRQTLEKTMGVTWLSATFAKRPDNMPIYASKTSMREVALDDEQLIGAIVRGGVALQEVISALLVSEGQMIRRERSFEGIEVNYITLDASQDAIGKPHLNKEQEHRAIFDRASEIIRDIILFQANYVDPEIKEMDKIMKAEMKQVEKRKGTSSAGVDNQPVFNGIFNVINQLLFSLKAEAVAERAIERLREGKAPVIAFANTMESFLNTITNDEGMLVQEGEIIKSDFSVILKRRLDSILKYTITDEAGKAKYEMLNINEMSEVFRNEYKRISQKITETAIGINISPIDVIKQKLEDAGYKVAEVTGRNRELKLRARGMAMVKNRNKINATDGFRQFNNNEVDVLMINQSGSTGASAHAVPTNKVTPDKVKQRVMIILQAELNINTEVQKRGRINRTGQIYKPIYDYLTSAVPAEKRLMMMLKKKLKSLDANTTSNQKQSARLVETDDFLNKYGDVVVVEYLKENPLVNRQIGDPLKMEQSKSDSSGEKEAADVPDKAHKVSGRIAIMSVKDQEAFYNEMSQRYVDLVEYLQQTGEYDLEVSSLNLQAKSLEKRVAVAGKGEGDSVFSRHSVLERCEVNVLKKPFKKIELDALLKESLGDYTALSLKEKTISDLNSFIENAITQNVHESEAHWKKIKSGITEERQYKKLDTASERKEYIEEREAQINEASLLDATRIQQRFTNSRNVLAHIFKFFHVGKVVAYPTATFDYDHSFHRAVFIGYDMKMGIKNPYAPSAVKLRFAVASGQKYIALPASKQDIIAKITSLTYSEILQHEQEDVIENWDEICKAASADRAIRYIVTGNILQAFGNEQLKGSLISYTTIEGGIKKGILLSETFDPFRKAERGEKGFRVSVPIIKARGVIKGMIEGRSIETNDKFSIIRRSDDYRILVPGSNKQGGKFFLNPTLIAMTNEKNFNKISGSMEATIDLNKIDNLIEFLQNEFNSTISLNPQEAEKVLGKIDLDYKDETANKTEKVFEKLTESDREAEEAFQQQKRKDTYGRSSMGIRQKLLNFSNLIVKKMSRGGEVESLMVNYRAKLEAMDDAQLQEEYVYEFGFDEQEAAKDIEEDRETVVNELVRHFGVVMRSRMDKGGTVRNIYAVCTSAIGKTEGTTKRSTWGKHAQKRYERCKAAMRNVK